MNVISNVKNTFLDLDSQLASVWVCPGQGKGRCLPLSFHEAVPPASSRAGHTPHPGLHTGAYKLRSAFVSRCAPLHGQLSPA